jgi:hypothetical protein
MATRSNAERKKLPLPPPPIEEDEEDTDEESDEDFVDPIMLLQSLLSTEEGETLCTALMKIHSQLEIHNKIMVKILSVIQSKK